MFIDLPIGQSLSSFRSVTIAALRYAPEGATCFCIESGSINISLLTERNSSTAEQRLF